MNAIDTNVLIYSYHDGRPDRQRVAKALLDDLSGNCTLLWQVACEFLSASRKVRKPSDPLTLPAERLNSVRQSLGLVLPTLEVLDRAAALQVRHQLQYWDALIYAACLEAGVTRLYSEDLPSQSIPGLEIINPFA